MTDTYLDTARSHRHSRRGDPIARSAALGTPRGAVAFRRGCPHLACRIPVVIGEGKAMPGDANSSPPSRPRQRPRCDPTKIRTTCDLGYLYVRTLSNTR